MSKIYFYSKTTKENDKAKLKKYTNSEITNNAYFYLDTIYVE